MRPSCQTLSNALEMSRKTPLTHSHQQCYQKLFVFHVVLIVTGQYPENG